ncbi:carboxypeptidase-like regulatory domain-containing protein [Actinoplanes sp. NEAU-A12]|uniref:Carboxypeptidase-like regulatory domain-containing protein n=1 Tax=Actinoplanes sandaracinus TaxID=3045177 RepID=A0ABT6WSE4_9ACTN|nr:carboxypeptidase-like regulatory domain-containing protein [Actinoplanes sandaracinus]MDI6102661.1 carboxypeptidase-like regulatory domain-containing protein [Actinoplanes sandaracinus]
MAQPLTPAERAGRVVDAAGRPVPYATVVIVAGTTPMPEIALRGDAEGRFGLRLPTGEFTLRAYGPAGTGDARVEGGAATDEIVITIGE